MCDWKGCAEPGTLAPKILVFLAFLSLGSAIASALILAGVL